MIPRPYQQEALNALDAHIYTKDTNPCVVIPTGGGKSALIAWAIQRWKEQAPHFRCCILQHRKELLEQNAGEIKAIYPECDIGIYSAALKRRDYDSSVLFASIDSVHRRAGEFTPWDVIMVDEAHRIPFSGEGKYRTFIAGSRKFNPQLRVIGWTATPFRMAGGQICHKDHILSEVCYEAKTTDLIRDGYLCQLRSKVGESQPDLKGVRKNQGDYVQKQLGQRAGDVVAQAIAEAARIIRTEDRRHVVFFCVDIEHCERVSRELRKHGIYAPAVTSKTNSAERDRVAAAFRAGRLWGICNVGIYTEGFNAPNIDCIVLLRPTLSPGLFSQMVGRGLRTGAGKSNCLVLDFAGCINEHGPVDLLGGQLVVVATCRRCRESFSRASRKCPACGWEIPKQEIERLGEVERQRRLHGNEASKKSILSGEPETYKVDSVSVNRHKKKGSPDSLRVAYRCGLSVFQEWVCLDHEGFTQKQAWEWWQKRSLSHNVWDVDDALHSDMFLAEKLLEWTRTITVVKKGKWFEVVDCNRPLIEK